MEQGLGQGAVPAAESIDKSRVLDIKPLRTLTPVFPSASGLSAFSSQGPPFVCASPCGPFPPGFTPFYPFAIPPESQRQPDQSPQTPIAVPNQAGHYGSNNSGHAAVPITSFRTPPSASANQHSGPVNGDVGPSKRRSKNLAVDGQSRSQSIAADDDAYSGSQNLSAQYLNSFSMHVGDGEGTSKVVKRRGRPLKRTKGREGVNLSSADGDFESIVNDVLTTYNLLGFDSLRVDGNNESVEFVLGVFNSLRRKITQIEEAKDANPGVTRRPDLRAGALMMNKGMRTNVKKRVGAVPGVEVGAIFYFRMEMCLLGMHAPSMAGIDYIGVRTSMEEEPLAVSIVSSGGYDDNAEDGNVLLYSGQGGFRRDTQIEDQKLERGNLALEKSLHRANEVRVIRGVRDVATVTGKVYVYDGLYKIQESWVEKAKSGCNTFKYKLIRVPGQPEAFVLWKLIQQWKDGITPRDGVILPDLTSGAESLPVALVNDVDDEKGPAYFTYVPTLKHSEPRKSLKLSPGCGCKGGCLPSNFNCSCIQKNGGYLPYTSSGVIVESKSMVYECGPSCPCAPNCKNRLSQFSLKFRLEVFKTKGKGWGLRSWDPIRAGAFICEYAGEVIDNSKMEGVENENENDYIFDTSLAQRRDAISNNPTDAKKCPFSLRISSKTIGNVARFMNHSCTANVFWQPVFHGSSTESDLHVAFFAIRHIPPLTELTYDYGMTDSSNVGRKRCLCGSLKCRGFF